MPRRNESAPAQGEEFKTGLPVGNTPEDAFDIAPDPAPGAAIPDPIGQFPSRPGRQIGE